MKKLNFWKSHHFFAYKTTRYIAKLCRIWFPICGNNHTRGILEEYSDNNGEFHWFTNVGRIEGKATGYNDLIFRLHFFTSRMHVSGRDCGPLWGKDQNHKKPCLESQKLCSWHEKNHDFRAPIRSVTWKNIVGKKIFDILRTGSYDFSYRIDIPRYEKIIN